MNKDTFGSSKKYKMLEYLTEKVSLLDGKSKRDYLSSFISEFNELTKKLKKIEDIKFKNYLLNLTYLEHIRKIDEMKNKFDDTLISYLKNYVYAKIKNS